MHQEPDSDLADQGAVELEHVSHDLLLVPDDVVLVFIQVVGMEVVPVYLVERHTALAHQYIVYVMHVVVLVQLVLQVAQRQLALGHVAGHPFLLGYAPELEHEGSLAELV